MDSDRPKRLPLRLPIHAVARAGILEQFLFMLDAAFAVGLPVAGILSDLPCGNDPTLGGSMVSANLNFFKDW
jgi:hypothetical protein